jgi:hypothetical protein
MVMSPVERTTLERVLHLRDEEVRLRERARKLELDPQRREAARQLFLRAGGVRKVRMALLERCGLR